MLSVSEETCSSREMHSYFRQASVTLKDIVSQPGVWDPFVLSYIHVRLHFTLCELTCIRFV